MDINFKNYLLETSGSSECQEIEVIQSLWSGYGKISRYQLIGSSLETVVVKCITLNQLSDHPRGWNTDNSHNRKVKSYIVETNWYEQWSDRCTIDCRVPTYLGSFAKGKDQWIVLEDLDENFPLRKHHINLSEVKVCLKWLANFHGTFLSQKPDNLWETGTYWYLDTRPDEFEKIENRELKSKAHLIDEVLNQCKFKTIVHGDAKLANFCFSEKGDRVAAVDFQYVGGGCGMKDVAYFLGSCLSSDDCELHEKKLLDFYFLELKLAIVERSADVDFEPLEKEWRELYPYACADFTRFLLGWMPSHQKINDYNLKILKAVLSAL